MRLCFSRLSLLVTPLEVPATKHWRGIPLRRITSNGVKQRGDYFVKKIQKKS